MKLGKDFWFWLKLIIQILRAILELQGKIPGLKLSPGHRAFETVMDSLIAENDDDDHKYGDLTKLVLAPAQAALHEAIADLHADHSHPPGAAAKPAQKRGA